LRPVVIALGIAVGAAGYATAQGRGEGGVVLRDDTPVYIGSTSDKVEATLMRGDAVAGITTAGIFGQHFEFEEDDGRLHVYYFRAPKYEGIGYTAWMDPGDLARFLYDCGCDTDSKGECRPYKTEFIKGRWNACFREAWAAKVASLDAVVREGTVEVGGSASAAGEDPSGARAAAEKPLTNDDVLALVALDLGDDLVVAKIQQVPSEALDVSTEALIELKQAGVSKLVLDAMIKRAALRK